LVLALKYRPKRFEEIIGQDSIVKTLVNSLDKNRLAHAYLFSGLRGAGKTTTARIFAKSLQCDRGPTSNPCEKCENCIMANENRHIDIIEMDAASNRKIEDIRELIEHTKYKPSVGKYKIFIIDEVHMLTNEAFNALLKTLEEPPEYVKFIMATTDHLASDHNSQAHYAKGSPSPLSEDNRAPNDCRQAVSGSISLPSPGFFSPFPHGTCALSV